MLPERAGKGLCCGRECFAEIISAISARGIGLLGAQKDFLLWPSQALPAERKGAAPVQLKQLLSRFKELGEAIAQLCDLKWSLAAV